jgi:uncharacterized protein
MVNRTNWQGLIEKAWQSRSLVWMPGVRRVGKTCLAQSLDAIEYFDCEIPQVRKAMEDPLDFWNSLPGKRVVLDEVHRLPNPSELLKIAADHYPKIRVLATGSSSLRASRKFRDTLTGRKTNLWLTPMVQADLRDFVIPNLQRRMLHGGLPEALLTDTPHGRNCQEWMDDYWAKDIEEMFHLELRTPFMKMTELLMIQSGGTFEATRMARACEISRPTVLSYLHALESTFVVHILRPYHQHRANEITSAPKVYAFDTGFVCHYRGWSALRPDDLGTLWEHLVLNEIHAATQGRTVGYWRDKQRHEVDFVWAPHRRAPLAIECKWSADAFEPVGIQSFRHQHPEGENLVVAHDVDRPFHRTYKDVKVRFVNIAGLIEQLTAPQADTRRAREKEKERD